MASIFHEKADAYLEALFDSLEGQDKNSLLELDLDGGIVTIELEDGRQWLVSKHEPSGEMWLSSPISGGLHFKNTNLGWQLGDERNLSDILANELSTATHCVFRLPLR